MLPVINLPLLAALTPADHTVTLIDENVEAIDFERCARADIVGVTGMNVQRARMHEILGELKKRQIFTVVGGPWVTVFPEDFGDVPDVVFVGEAEETWPRFLVEWREGRHGRHYEQAEKTDMATVPPPRLDLLRMSKYVYGSVQLSRGCPFTCEFCDIIVVFGRRPRVKGVSQVIAELEGCLAVGKTNLFIVDDNLIGNKKVIKGILREIIAWQEARGYPLSFATEASIDLAEDEELLRLMFDANITEVFVGIESPNEEALRETKKSQNLTDRHGSLLDKVHRIQRAGIEVWCGMIVGFDTDDESVFDLQRRFLRDARIPLAMVNVLVAIPRTPLFARLQKEGRLDNSGELSSFGTVSTNVIPKRISRRALCDGYLALIRDLYTPEAYFGRLDALYLEGELPPASARTRYLRRHPWRRLKAWSWSLAETVFIVMQLMRGVPDATLRREYRWRLWNVVKRPKRLHLLRIYAIRCALHFHFDRLIAQMLAERAQLKDEGDEGDVELVPAKIAVGAGR
ncbi:DUF4070 domain-containing protein [Rhodopila sp.]|uniref:DUF4070 domain-containing protein n=1 Tax=Rhodopila sp. TaxID=2480087 RepID=UPI003D0E7C2D